MKIEEISNYADFVSLKDEWNTLLKNSDTDSIFLRHEWFDCWWKSHASNAENAPQLYILLIKNNEGKIIGIFPFLRCRATYRRLSVKQIGCLQSGLTPHIDFILTGDKEKIINTVLTHLCLNNQWDIIALNTFPAYSETHTILLKALRSKKIKFGSQPSLNSPVIRTTGDWEEYLSSRPQKFRKSIRNKLNRIKKNPDISIEKFSDPQQIISFALPHVYAIAKNSWKARKKHAFVDSKAYTSFYSMFTEVAAPCDWVNIWLLKYKDKYIAHEYHLKYNNKIYPIGADYDDSYKKLSPGSILEYNIIKSLFENQEIKEYPTCAHDYKYLRNWTDTFYPHVNIEIFSSNLFPSILYFTEYKLFPLLSKIKLIRNIKNSMGKRGLRLTK